MICGCKNILWSESVSRESQILKNYAEACLHKSTLAENEIKIYSILCYEF